MGDLSSVGSGVHHQHLQVLDVGDQESLVAGRSHESGLLVGTITDGWLWDVASESSSDNGVDTLLLSPVLRDSLVAVRVMTLELLCVFLHNLRVW